MRTVIRATAVLIEGDRILLVRENVANNRNWSLPGGKMEQGESLHQCLIREMREETGLVVNVGRMLYLGERKMRDLHVIHATFEVSLENETAVSDTHAPLKEFVRLGDLEAYGFSQKFKELAMNNFPRAGSYVGAIENIGL